MKLDSVQRIYQTFVKKPLRGGSLEFPRTPPMKVIIFSGYVISQALKNLFPVRYEELPELSLPVS